MRSSEVIVPIGNMVHIHPISSPVVTLLSRSPVASRRTQSLLQSLFGMKPICLPRQEEVCEDGLDFLFPSFLRGWNRWDSVASQCPSSGAVLHLLSLSCQSVDDDDDGIKNGGKSLSLISVTQGFEGGKIFSNDSASASVFKARRLLARRVREVGNSSTALAVKITMCTALGQRIDSSHLFGSCAKIGLPYMCLPSANYNSSDCNSRCAGGDIKASTFRLREVVLPYFDDAMYEDGSSLMSRLGDSALSRPLVGLYQWPQNGIAFRPLPAAKEDLTLPPPSLVFGCESLDNAQQAIDDSGAISAKVGFSGNGRKGQLIVRHDLLTGLDFRMCEAGSSFSSIFAEAEESLLAGSLDDLQNANVMAEGGAGIYASSNSVQGKSDAMNGLGDCWIEFRANMRNPSGFWQKRNQESSKRIVKPPHIPYPP